MEGWNSWQNKCTSLKSRFEHLLKHSLATDVDFFIGPEKYLFKAHKIMFFIASSVFYDKFAMVKNLKVEFPYTTPSAFHALLEYLYTDKSIGDDNNIVDLFKFAEEFKIKQLKAMTLGYIKKRLQSDNNKFFLKNLLNFPTIWQLPELYDSFSYSVTVRSLDIFNVENVKVLQTKHIKAILDSEVIKQSETDVFNFAICWAKSKLTNEFKRDIKPRERNLLYRETLGLFLYLIRFPSMTIEEFKSITQEYDGLLTTAEVFDIVAYISNPQSKVIGFNTNKRGTTLIKSKTVVSATENLKIKLVESLQRMPDSPTVASTAGSVAIIKPVRHNRNSTATTTLRKPPPSVIQNNVTNPSTSQSHDVSAKINTLDITCPKKLVDLTADEIEIGHSLPTVTAINDNLNKVMIVKQKLTTLTSTTVTPITRVKPTASVAAATPTPKPTISDAVASSTTPEAGVTIANQSLLNNKRGRLSNESLAKKGKFETKTYVRKCKQPQDQ